jgi:hypothetical protein
LRVRGGPPNSAARSEVFAAPFADRADLSPRLARRLAGLKKPGRRFPGVARAPHVPRCRDRLRRLVSDRAGLAGLGSPTRPLRSFAHLESPFARRTPPWPGDDRPVGALLGFFPSRACSSNPRVRCARGRTKVGTNPCLMRPRDSSTWPRVFARSRVRPRGLEPATRRRRQSIEPASVTVGQRTCLQAVSRSACPPFASPEPRPRRDPKVRSLA